MQRKRCHHELLHGPVLCRQQLQVGMCVLAHVVKHGEGRSSRYPHVYEDVWVLSLLRIMQSATCC